VGAAGAIRRDRKYAVRVELGHVALMRVILPETSHPACQSAAIFLSLTTA
jgi:hypothetical protein